MKTSEDESSSTKSAPADWGASSEETRSAVRIDVVEEGMVLDPPLTQAKE
jgi:hypothetical protein